MNAFPSEAIIAVTLNCNSRCVMCNIWENRIKGEVEPSVYLKLPSSLTTINITGGEPFLRGDLTEIVRNMKKASPRARLVINTNGYLVSRIKKAVPELLKIDPGLALRISLDGIGKTHDRIRRLPHFYTKAMESLDYCRKAGIRDLGISYTLMEQNKSDLLPLFDFCAKNRYQFSLTVATDSPIYFGKGKMRLRPPVNEELKTIFRGLIDRQYRSRRLKDWLRAWFNKRLLEYMQTGKRRFACDAGKDFFYMDSLGKIYVCQMKPWLLGDLTNQTAGEIFRKNAFVRSVNSCNDCWMVCSARALMKQHMLAVGAEITADKISAKGST